MLPKLIWLSLLIASLNSPQNLVKSQEVQEPVKPELNPESNPVLAKEKEKEDDGNKKENDSAIAYLGDYKVLPIQTKEVKTITCKGEHCNQVELKEPDERNLAYIFELAKPLPDTLNGTYNLVCRNIEDNNKRKCTIEFEVQEKNPEKKPEGTGEEEKKKESDSKKHLPFIFGFLGAELLVVLVLSIVFGLNGKGPLKTFLKPDRS